MGTPLFSSPRTRILVEVRPAGHPSDTATVYFPTLSTVYFSQDLLDRPGDALGIAQPLAPFLRNRLQPEVGTQPGAEHRRASGTVSTGTNRGQDGGLKVIRIF